MTREEFLAVVADRTPEEIVAAIGKPVTTQAHGRNGQIWYYERMTRDPLTEQVDPSVQVIFENGRVVRVSY